MTNINSLVKNLPLVGIIMSNKDKDFPEEFKILRLLSEQFMTVAQSKGFYSSPEYNLAADCAALHAEVSELWEAWRADALHLPCNKQQDMLEKVGSSLTCQEEEIADLIIKSLVMAKALQVDIAKAVFVKNEYNKTRPFRHGKKR